MHSFSSAIIDASLPKSKEKLLQPHRSEMIKYTSDPEVNFCIFKLSNLPSVQVFPVKPGSGQKQEYFPALSRDKHDCFSGQGTPQGFCQKMKNADVSSSS